MHFTFAIFFFVKLILIIAYSGYNKTAFYYSIITFSSILFLIIVKVNVKTI